MAHRDCLHAEEKLARGQRLYSKNRAVELHFQDDGNLVLYRRKDLTPLWSSNTDGRDADTVIMQHDGNLVMYEHGQPIWKTDTHGHSGATLSVQDDGNLVLYNPANQSIWASNTDGLCPQDDQSHLHPGEKLTLGASIHSPSGNLDLILQRDGNLVLYRTHDDYALWSSNTHGLQIKEAVMQEDGNFVVYDVHGQAVWSSDTTNYFGACCKVQDDGNLCKKRATSRDDP
ncbi:hypothetical protein RvY_13294 [Ramazzottius varieornatus]|uniref:Bulb-type lectin domain-containing protein n=1 Tax=Ramazzottius varieornatus TaxID=947166 RepID=A0A1D1VMC4_RAMVA|nr:hypothetical protein RvY_13294 [Ramazzottius varieornatus]